jgi:hypothetical protein
VGTKGSKRTALAAKPAGAYGDIPDGHVPFGGACPDQGDKPADDRPAKQQIHYKNAREVALVPGHDRGQKIQERRKNQKCHVLTPFRSSAFPNKPLRSLLSTDTLELTGLFPWFSTLAAPAS